MCGRVCLCLQEHFAESACSNKLDGVQDNLYIPAYLLLYWDLQTSPRNELSENHPIGNSRESDFART